ncbi:Intracellular exo-alpha-(1-_5)-L-arabinofuranosidase [bioreactor metagenome]|uniref:Intracellular exo-alpha-(1->5)-L-arabinofuranosidase n=1 Tax=bioreactor metagenome TaxID=1076179 RepID=A0A645CZW4_9ZZZZ
MLNTLLRNADVVRIACLAQLVNTIAPIMTEPNGRAWVQTIYYPFLFASRHGRGSSLCIQVESPTYSCAVGGAIPFVDGAATLSRDEREIVLFLVNRSAEQRQDCQISIARAAAVSIVECVSLSGFSAESVNTADSSPVMPQQNCNYVFDQGVLFVTLPQFSWNMIRISIQ